MWGQAPRPCPFLRCAPFNAFMGVVKCKTTMFQSCCFLRIVHITYETVGSWWPPCIRPGPAASPTSPIRVGEAAGPGRMHGGGAVLP